MNRLAVIGLVCAAGCSSLLGIEDLGSTTDDGGVVIGDGPLLKMTGSVQILDTATQPGPGANLEVLDPQGRVLGTTVSDANGMFSLTWRQTTPPSDIHIGASLPNTLDAFVYFEGLITGDLLIDVQVFTPAGLQQFSSAVGVNQSAASGAIVMFAFTSDGAPLAGATFESQPGAPLFYTGPDGRPMMGLTSTDPTFPAAWIFNAPSSLQLVLRSPSGSSGTRSLNAPPSSVSFVPMAL